MLPLSQGGVVDVNLKVYGLGGSMTHTFDIAKLKNA